MLDLAAVTAEDVVYDLGCGDGRVVIRAAERCGARGVGIDCERHWIEVATAAAAAAGVAGRTRFEHGDALAADLADATVVTVYLVEWSTTRVAALVRACARPGTRIVSHSFPIDGWPPDRSVVVVDGAETHHAIHLWTVPLPETEPERARVSGLSSEEA